MEVREAISRESLKYESFARNKLRRRNFIGLGLTEIIVRRKRTNVWFQNDDAVITGINTNTELEVKALNCLGRTL